MIWFLLGCTAGDAGLPADSATGTGDSGGDSAVDYVGPGEFAALPDLAGKNIVLMHIDTLRADHLSTYGYDRDTLPQSGGLDWYILDRTYAAAPWTAPSTMSMLSALQPHHHDVRYPIIGSNTELNDTWTGDNAANWFHDAGWYTSFISGNNYAGSSAGADQHWDHFEVVADGSRLLSASDASAALLDSLPESGPFFGMIQPMDVHSPYHHAAGHEGAFVDADAIPFDTAENTSMGDQMQQIREAYAADPDATREAVIGVYDEGILGVDDAVVALRAGLEARGQLENTVIVLFADHGETLDDDRDGTFEHGLTIQPETARVPLMLLGPGIDPGHSACIAEAEDLVPTLMQAAGISVPQGLDGHPLSDGCRDHARTTLYVAGEGGISQVSVSDGSVMVKADCTTGERTSETMAWELPAATPEADLDTALAAHVADITAALGEGCEGF